MVGIKLFLKRIVCLAFFVFYPLYGEPTIEVKVQDAMASENTPVFAKVIITHAPGEKIDIRSFELDGRPIQVYNEGSFEARASFGLHGAIQEHKEFFTFQVQDVSKGKHVLGSVAVNVGGQRCESEPVTYFIEAPQISKDFDLKAFVDAPSPLYPGQHFTVTYQWIMAKPMEAFYNNLPLLELKFAQKQGKLKEHAHYIRGRHVEEYTQTYQAKEVGVHSIEPSFIEGREYVEDVFSRRHYHKQMCRAQTEALRIEVADFPQEGKPASFTGAIGEFSLTTELDSPSQVCLGDKIKLKITIEGPKYLETVQLPKIAEQKGFKDHFRLNDLPVTAKTHQTTKTFICELRPMKETITEVPSLEFSYFDLKSEKYHTLHSEPIPLTLLPMKANVELPSKTHLTALDMTLEQKNAVESADWIEDKKTDLIDIQGVFPISHKDLEPVKPSLNFWKIVVVLGGLLIAQFLYKSFRGAKRNEKNSAFYLREALKHKDHLQKYQLLIEKSLLERLKEQKYIKEAESVDQLGSQGITGEVKEFVQYLQMQLFAKEQDFNLEESLVKARAIYKKIGDPF